MLDLRHRLANLRFGLAADRDIDVLYANIRAVAPGEIRCDSDYRLPVLIDVRNELRCGVDAGGQVKIPDELSNLAARTGRSVGNDR